MTKILCPVTLKKYIRKGEAEVVTQWHIMRLLAVAATSPRCSFAVGVHRVWGKLQQPRDGHIQDQEGKKNVDIKCRLD